MLAKPFGLVFGDKVVDFGNSCIKSVSLGQLSRNPIEFRSEPVSGVEGFGVSSGLDAVAGGRVLTHFLPNSVHLRQGTVLSHLTFSLEHSSHACRFLPLSSELGIADVPLFSHRLKWSLKTSLRLKVLEQNLQL